PSRNSGRCKDQAIIAPVRDQQCRRRNGSRNCRIQPGDDIVRAAPITPPQSPNPKRMFVMARSAKKKISRAARRGAVGKPKAPARKAAGKAKASGRSRGPTPKPVVIDVHAHILVPEVMNKTFEHTQYARSVAAQGVPEPLLKRMTEAPPRLKDMDEAGVDIQVLSPSIMQQCTYGMEPEQALAMERLGNDRVAEAVAQHPHRLVGLGSLPLQDVARSTGELERCVRELGLRGVIISSHINGTELGDPRLRPFWGQAAGWGTVIFLLPV